MGIPLQLYDAVSERRRQQSCRCCIAINTEVNQRRAWSCCFGSFMPRDCKTETLKDSDLHQVIEYIVILAKVVSVTIIIDTFRRTSSAAGCAWQPVIQGRSYCHSYVSHSRRGCDHPWDSWTKKLLRVLVALSQQVEQVIKNCTISQSADKTAMVSPVCRCSLKECSHCDKTVECISRALQPRRKWNSTGTPTWRLWNMAENSE